MNPLDWAAIIALVLVLAITRYANRAAKAQLAREQAILDAKLQKEHDAWLRNIRTREAALQPPSEN